MPDIRLANGIGGRQFVAECHSRNAGADRILHSGKSRLRQPCMFNPRAPVRAVVVTVLLVPVMVNE